MSNESSPRPLTERFSRALELACDLHRTQSRKGTDTPYVAHLLAVASLVLEHGGSEDEAIGAALHDAVEDQGGARTADLIRTQFGDAVTEIVLGCSDTDVVPKPPWRARKEAHLRHLASASPSVRLVCAADKLHNARSLLNDLRVSGDAVWGRFKGGRDGTLWYYRETIGVLAAGGASALVDELARVVGDIERLAKTDEA